MCSGHERNPTIAGKSRGNCEAKNRMTDENQNESSGSVYKHACSRFKNTNLEQVILVLHPCALELAHRTELQTAD